MHKVDASEIRLRKPPPARQARGCSPCRFGGAFAGSEPGRTLGHDRTTKGINTMHSRSLLFIIAACLAGALTSCGSGSAGFPGSEGGTSPDQQAGAWKSAVDKVKTARRHADESIDAAAAAPSATALNRASAALNAYVEAAEDAVEDAESLQGVGGNDQRTSARVALETARSYRTAKQRMLEDLQASPSGSESSESPGAAVQRRLKVFDSRLLTHLERGHFYRNSGDSIFIREANLCSESDGRCNSGSAEQYFDPATFFPTVHAIAPFAAAPTNGIDTFVERGFEEPFEPSLSQHRQLLALGKYSVAKLYVQRELSGTSLAHLDNDVAALGVRHDGRPDGPSGSATWRGQMVGVAMDSGSLLAGESALTYSFDAGTVDVEISDIRAIDEVLTYSGGNSFTWSGLRVNTDGSFHIAGYNNDRSGVTFDSAHHSTLGYIDGDFYGPNAEEASGIFTRDNVNGAWVANCVGSCSEAEAQAPLEEQAPRDLEFRQLTDGSVDTKARSRLSDLGSRSLTNLEAGYTYRSAGGSTSIFQTSDPCSESGGGCTGLGISTSAEQYFSSTLAILSDPIGSFTATPINGVETFSQGVAFWLGQPGQRWSLLALGEYSAAYLYVQRALSGTSFESALHYSAAFGERHDGRPAGSSGSATWRGQMVGIAMDSGSLLAGESALTYSFDANTVDVEISNIRSNDDDFAYTGSSSLTWNDLSVNSDGSFYIPGYNNDRSIDAFNSALHPTLGYIDGDFYGPNAEEASGIFTRNNVNGAWAARK